MTTKRMWAARIMKYFIVLFMTFDGVIHIIQPPQVVDAFYQLGFPISVALPLAIVELICLALYVIPRTTVVGAILMTGYFGGAVATNLRVESSLFGNILFPVYVAIIMWLALYFSDRRVSDLIPFVKK